MYCICHRVCGTARCRVDVWEWLCNPASLSGMSPPRTRVPDPLFLPPRSAFPGFSFFIASSPALGLRAPSNVTDRQYRSLARFRYAKGVVTFPGSRSRRCRNQFHVYPSSLQKAIYDSPRMRAMLRARAYIPGILGFRFPILFPADQTGRAMGPCKDGAFTGICGDPLVPRLTRSDGWMHSCWTSHSVPRV